VYFNNFPNINYLKEDGSLSSVKDIIRRVIFTDESYFNESNFFQYRVQDGDTPELIAQRFYGDPELHFIVILYNTAFDPFYSFPLSRVSFDKFVEKKYSGQALFLGSVDNVYVPFSSTSESLNEGDLITTTRDEPIYNGAMTVEKFNIDTTAAQIKKIDYSLSKLELFNQSGKYFEFGDKIARRSTILDTFRAKVGKVVQSRFAPHHFEFNNQILNPLATAPDASGVQQPLNGSSVTYVDTILYRYIFNDVDTYVKTNEDYEYDLNDAKKQIRIPKADSIQSLVSEFKRAIREG